MLPRPRKFAAVCILFGIIISERHPVCAKDVYLFNGDNESLWARGNTGASESDYVNKINSLSEGDRVVFSNGKSYKLGKLLGAGNSALIYDLPESPGQAIRLAKPLVYEQSFGRVADFTLTQLAKNLVWLENQPKFQEIGIRVPEIVDTFVNRVPENERTRPDIRDFAEYIVVSKINGRSLNELMSNFANLDKHEISTLTDAFFSFSKLTSRYEAFPDLRLEQIYFDGKNLALLDWNGPPIPFEGYKRQELGTTAYVSGFWMAWLAYMEDRRQPDGASWSSFAWNEAGGNLAKAIDTIASRDFENKPPRLAMEDFFRETDNLHEGKQLVWDSYVVGFAYRLAELEKTFYLPPTASISNERVVVELERNLMHLIGSNQLFFLSQGYAKEKFRVERVDFYEFVGKNLIIQTPEQIFLLGETVNDGFLTRLGLRLIGGRTFGPGIRVFPSTAENLVFVKEFLEGSVCKKLARRILSRKSR